MNSNLNNPRIHKYVSWVAQYGKKLRFVNNYYKGNYGWQYQSNGYVSGVNGEVDVSCFSNFYGYDSSNHINQPLGRDSSTPYLEYRANNAGVEWFHILLNQIQQEQQKKFTIISIKIYV